MPPTEPVTTGQVVCVLGMHRSGTSLTTRVLNLLGVYLGSDDSTLASDRLNAKGYWEHESILEINDELLARFDGSWHAPPVFRRTGSVRRKSRTSGTKRGSFSRKSSRKRSCGDGRP